MAEATAMQQLQDKVAIVTGAAAGFGEGIVRLYVEHGARVVIADLDAGKGDALAAQLGTATRFVRCDVSVGRDVAALYLASDAAEFISGVELPVDGARTV
jgi:NAD(P)-dependent dehydrogenase (short-subunit alcohol dehydrogenase family)